MDEAIRNKKKSYVEDKIPINIIKQYLFRSFQIAHSRACTQKFQISFPIRQRGKLLHQQMRSKMEEGATQPRFIIRDNLAYRFQVKGQWMNKCSFDPEFDK